MKICRFNDNRIGVVRDDGVHDVTAILDKFEAVRYPFPLGDQLIERLDELRPELESLADGGDHTIVIGRVDRFQQQSTDQPLLFWDGKVHEKPSLERKSS